MSGVVYADLDGDCVQSGSDIGLPYRVLTVQPGNHFMLTDADGLYAAELFYDAYELDAPIAGYAALCPTLPASFTLDAANMAEVIDVSMDPSEAQTPSLCCRLGFIALVSCVIHAHHRERWSIRYHRR